MQSPRPLHTLAAASLLACLATSAHAVTLPAAEDTFSAKTSVTKTANLATSLSVAGATTVDKKAFIQFNLADVPAGKTAADVLSARFRIYLAKVTKPGVLTVHKVTGVWDEAAVITTPPPAFDATAVATIAAVDVETKHFVSVDVTQIVKDWITTPLSNEGLAVKGDTVASVLIGSKEGTGTGHPAELEIVFIATGVAGPAGPAGATGAAGPAGATGATGAQGPIGLTGAQGTQGTQGIQGPAGTLDDGSVTTAKLAAGAVTPAKLDLSTGNVGIGTASPQAPLEIRGGGAPNPTLIMAGAGGVVTKFLNSTNGNNLWDTFASATSYAISRSGIDFPFVIDFTSGNVGVGTATPSVKLEVAGGIKCVGAVDTSSDARYKMNIAPLSGALGQVLRLRGVGYDWNREAFPGKGFDDRHQLGFIAQEVREILPAVVSEDPDGYLSIGYTAIIPVLAEAVEELKQQKDAEVNALQEENAALRKRVAALEAKDKAREARLTRLENALDDRPARTVRASLDLE